MFRVNKCIIIFLIIGCILVVVAGFRPVGIDKDSLMYVSTLSTLKDNFEVKEPTFWLIAKISTFFESYTVFFVIYAVLGVGIKLIAILKYSVAPLVSLLMYICFFFILLDMTQIRASVAVAMFLISIENIVSKNFKYFIIKILIGALFHYSILFFIPFYLLNSNKINKLVYIFLPLIGIFIMESNLFLLLFHYLNFLLPSFISFKLGIYIDMMNNNQLPATKPFSVGNIFLIFILFYSIFYLNYKNEYKIIFIKLFSFSYCILFSFSFLEVFAYRLSTFLLISIIFIFPMLLNSFKQKFIPLVLIIVYSIYTLIKNIDVLLDVSPLS